jgi:ABC-type dipeptide/oligopeptide/nickel transport system permease subunit
LPVALIGIVTATLGLFAFRQFHAFFVFGLVAVCLLGIVLGTGMMWIGPAVGVLSLPIVAGLVTGSTLEVPTRNASGRPPLPRIKI